MSVKLIPSGLLKFFSQHDKLGSGGAVSEPLSHEGEALTVSVTALQLFEQMQDADFASKVAEFMSMSSEEIGDAARKAVADHKTSR